jgi:hypothetical protein
MANPDKRKYPKIKGKSGVGISVLYSEYIYNPIVKIKSPIRVSIPTRLINEPKFLLSLEGFIFLRVKVVPDVKTIQVMEDKVKV